MTKLEKAQEILSKDIDLLEELIELAGWCPGKVGLKGSEYCSFTGNTISCSDCWEEEV